MNDPIIDRSEEQKKMRVEKLREELDAMGYHVVQMSRYQVRTDNIEHRCCYSATVVDTTRLTSYGKYPEIVAECPDEEMAAQIALALNRHEMQR